jgi:hypothetical protein
LEVKGCCGASGLPTASCSKLDVAAAGHNFSGEEGLRLGGCLAVA